jgi:hypothetical protein
MFHFQKKFDKKLDDLLKTDKVVPSTLGVASPLRLVGEKACAVRI